MATEYQLVGPTLYNGARDADGGIWIRVDSLDDHRILRHAILKALKNHEAATNTLAALDEEAPAHVDYIRAALERVKAAILGALPAKEQLRGTPIGDAIQQTVLKFPERPDELEPEEVELMDAELLELLGDIGADVTGDEEAATVESWNLDTRREVYRWARALKLTEGGARRDIGVPPRPNVVKVEWFAQTLKAAVERGARDRETLAFIALDPAQVAYWLTEGPWRIAEYSRENGDGTELEYAVEYGEATKGEKPKHPFVYPTKEEAKLVAAQMNRRTRLDEAHGNAEKRDAIVQGEPLPLNEQLLTEELQRKVIVDLNDSLRATGDSKFIIDKQTMAVGALRKWYRAGPYTAQRQGEDEVQSGDEARYRIVKEMSHGRYVGTIDAYDIYEAHVRAAVLNRAEFQTGQLWNDAADASGEENENEAERAVEEGAKKKKARGKPGKPRRKKGE
jgi:hypothetical protein